MRRLNHIEGYAPRRYARLPGQDVAALRCYGGGSSSSSTSAATNYAQATLDTGGGSGFVVGAGAQTGNLSITSGDTQTAQMAITGAGQAAVAASEQAGHAEDVVAGIANQSVNTVGSVAGAAIKSNADTAQSLGGAAINLGAQAVNAGAVLGTSALQYGQNITALNLNALNQNTALAFSTIAALDTSRAAGETSGAARDLANLAAQIGSQGTGGTPTVIYQPAQPMPYTGTTASGIDTTTVLILAALGIGAIFILKKE